MPLDFDSLFSQEDDFSDPLKFARSTGILDSWDSSTPNQQVNYLDDNFGNFTRDLPIEQPAGSIVSGGKEDLYHKYSQMLEQRPESERVLQDYLSRRPSREDYQPGLGRKIIAGIMGLSSGLRGGPEKAFSATQGFLQQPYNEALGEYKDEGKFVDDAMRLSDSARNRQIQGILGQIRAQEMERAARAREGQTGLLRSIQQQNADRQLKKDAAELTRQAEDRKLRERQLGISERGLGLRERALNALNEYRNKSLTQRGGKPTSPTQQLAQRKLNSQRLMSTDPRFMSMMGRYQEDPETFLSDEPGSDTPEDQALQDSRRQFAIYQTLMQLMDQE